MIYVTIIDANGVEQSSNEVTESIGQDILEPAARVTVEIHNRDNPDDLWEVKIVDTEKVDE